MEILLILSGFIFACFVALLYEYKIKQIRKKPKNNIQQTNNALKQINNVHFYVARNKNGELWLYIGKPKRGYDTFFFYSSDAVMYLGHGDTLKMYGLNEHDYDSLKWEDEPVEVFITMKD